MFGQMDETQLNAGLAYLLAECPQCGVKYAVTPDPVVSGKWAFYQRAAEGQPLSHICTGGLLCLRGHELTVTLQQAVLTQEGAWLNVPVPDAQPVLN